MSRLIELLTGEGGILRVRALLAFGLTGTVCFLALSELPVPEPILILDGTALGFYFAQRAS
ncbi:hypothetical protein LCGC14_3012670 [marine sediment metagenome]|uniref:Uncharacterized protein n=1 Tax=marine sediment metagenome TaxID=412755 RepID=A0A0F8Z5D3_9ZZZZ